MALAVSLVLTAAFLEAQDKPYPVGTIRLEATAIAAGVGFSWGKGTLTFQGKDYPISVEGLDVAAVGISKVSANGDVFNLNSPNDIVGTYVAGGAGIAIVGGAKGQLARNEKGVVIDLVAAQKGVALNLGPSGFTIKMK
jgi:hypothetical protein